MAWMLDRVGRHIASYLQQPASGYEPFTPADPKALQALIKPGDILLIEGRTHIAGVIKYLTQSTWSHAALYVGPIDGQTTSNGEPCDLVESNMEAGIISVPLSTYFDYHTRICRPVGLSPEDRQAVCDCPRDSDEDWNGDRTESKQIRQTGGKQEADHRVGPRRPEHPLLHFG